MSKTRKYTTSIRIELESPINSKKAFQTILNNKITKWFKDIQSGKTSINIPNSYSVNTIHSTQDIESFAKKFKITTKNAKTIMDDLSLQNIPKELLSPQNIIFTTDSCETFRNQKEIMNALKNDYDDEKYITSIFINGKHYSSVKKEIILK
jgi:hypothetical protein